MLDKVIINLIWFILTYGTKFAYIYIKYFLKFGTKNTKLKSKEVKMGRVLEFALTMLLITIFQVGFSFFVISIINSRITELFEIINSTLRVGGL